MFGSHPDRWTEFMEKRDPGVWEYLETVLRETKGQKPQYEYWIEYYTDLMKNENA